MFTVLCAFSVQQIHKQCYPSSLISQWDGWLDHKRYSLAYPVVHQLAPLAWLQHTLVLDDQRDQSWCGQFSLWGLQHCNQVGSMQWQYESFIYDLQTVINFGKLTIKSHNKYYYRCTQYCIPYLSSSPNSLQPQRWWWWWWWPLSQQVQPHHPLFHQQQEQHYHLHLEGEIMN